MAKLVNQPVLVVTDGKCRPRRFFWIRHWVDVQSILEEWKDTGCWWDGETEKTFYRLAGSGGAVYELFADRKLNQWNLYRVLD